MEVIILIYRVVEQAKSDALEACFALLRIGPMAGLF